MFILDVFHMIADIGRTSRAVNIWGASLNIPQFVGGLIFIAYIEGQLILAMVIFTLLVAGQIHKRSPFSRLIGLCHIPWLLLLPWLLYRMMNFEHSTWLQIWLCYTSITIAISLIFDAWDIHRYFKGKRTFAWTDSESD